MNAVVVYRSQTGSSKRYAQWLAEDLSCDAVPLEELDRAAATCDLVVLCSWFHAASIMGAKQFRTYMAAHPEKRYAVIAVGATPMPEEDYPPEEHEETFRKSFPADTYADLPWCYCQGDFHFEKLGFSDKLMMRAYFKMLDASAHKGSKRDAVALAGMKAGMDCCDRTYLEPLVEELRRRGWTGGAGGA